MENQVRYEQFNPFRHPAWRQKRVLQLVEALPKPKAASRKYDDEHVKDYRAFLLQLKAAYGKPDPETSVKKLFFQNPGLYYAHECFTHSDQEWRDMVEARILTREPDEYIAEQFHTLPETITWYERLFFNVRDRINSKSYIVKTVLGRYHQRSTNTDEVLLPQQLAICYKLFAYFGGPLVLDIILAGFDESPMPVKNAKAREYIDDVMQRGISRHSAMSSQTFSVNKYNVMQLFEIQQRFMATEAEARAASGGAGADYEQNIARFFEQIPLAVGEAAAENRTPETLKFEATAIEPRASEQLQLAHGTVPDSLQKKLDYKRPEPTKREGVRQHDAEQPPADE